MDDGVSTFEKVRREELERAYRDVFASTSGKRVLFDMLEKCAIYRDAYQGEFTNATNYSLGRQAVGRDLISKLDEIDPHFYPQLLLDIAEIKAVDLAASNSMNDHLENEDEVDA